MKHLHILAGASALAFAAVFAALPASAQSTGGAMPQGSGTQTSPSTGALPDNSLAGQRQGTVGGSVSQGGGGQSGTSGSSTPDPSASGATSGSTSGTGALPDNSLAGQRQGTIGGGSVSQGGNTTSEPPKQGSGQ